MKNLLLYNFELKDNNSPDFIPDSIYEVIRVNNSIPLFITEHLLRLYHSLRFKFGDSVFDWLGDNITSYYIVNEISQKSDRQICDENEFAQNFQHLIFYFIEKCGILSNNIRIDILFDGSYKLYIRPIKSTYPPSISYDLGVKTVSANIERQNPNVKFARESYKRAIENIKATYNTRNEYIGEPIFVPVYEVILVNKSNFITEGSKSNIFFIRGDQIYTPPITEVLGGITRHVLMRELKERDIEVIEQMISIDDIVKYDGCFLTGTSIGALPVNAIDKVTFNTSSLEIYKLCKKILEV